MTITWIREKKVETIFFGSDLQKEFTDNTLLNSC